MSEGLPNLAITLFEIQIPNNDPINTISPVINW
jgi:hypothetical protein